MSKTSDGLVLSSAVVAAEVLTESVVSQTQCPCCSAALGKSVFADGDSERCLFCGEELWFELRNNSVIPRRARQEIQGTSLSQLLKARSLSGIKAG